MREIKVPKGLLCLVINLLVDRFEGTLYMKQVEELRLLVAQDEELEKQELQELQEPHRASTAEVKVSIQELQEDLSGLLQDLERYNSSLQKLLN